MKRTVTTTEAAWLVGVHPGSFHRWATYRDLSPDHRVRIGRSTITVWSVAALADAQQRHAEAAKGNEAGPGVV